MRLFLAEFGRRPTFAELADPPQEVQAQVIQARLRKVHADAAQNLALYGFIPMDEPEERVYLLGDHRLREMYGKLIGDVASSHHWTLRQAEEKFANVRYGGPAWHGWEVDTLKIGYLLRACDAAHLDVHRASTLQMLFRRPSRESREHWKFQNQLHPPVMSGIEGELEYRSTRPFRREDREAWWLAYDMLQNTTDQELRGVNKILRRNGRTPFAVGGVAGVDNPEAFAQYVETSDWSPVDIKVRIIDVASVIDRFGGTQLYGSDLQAPVRELIANAADAVRARRQLADGGLGGREGRIVLRLGHDEDGPWLEIEDNGVGMSDEVLRGPLLDFGNSFWGSALAVQEFPGLTSSGFRPTGKFGIGFFPVFMLGSRVKLTTRRYDSAINDTLVLELEKGLKYPMLRRPDSATVDEIVPHGGTRLRIQLDKDPWTNRGLVGEVTARIEGRDELNNRKKQMLMRFISRLAPTLDVDVQFEIEGSSSTPVLAVSAVDWESLAFEDLLQRVATGRETWGTRVTNHICEPKIEGRLVGRFRLVSDRATRTRTNVMAIGGLSARWGEMFFEGVIVGEHPQLDRSGGKPLLAYEALVHELRKTVEAGFLPNHPASPGLADYLLQHGVTPKGLYCFLSRDQDFDMDGLAEYATGVEPGDEILLLENDSFYYEDELGGTTDHATQDMWEFLDVNEPHIVIAPGRHPMAWNRGVEYPRATGSNDATPSPVTLLHLAETIICESWAVERDQVNGYVENRTVAYLRLRDESVEPVNVECYVLRRPVQ